MQKIILASKARAFRPEIAPHLLVLFPPSNKDVMQIIILADEARAFPPGAEAQSGRQPHLVLTRPEPSHIYATSTTGARRTLNYLRRRAPQGGAHRRPLIIRHQIHFKNKIKNAIADLRPGRARTEDGALHSLTTNRRPDISIR